MKRFTIFLLTLTLLLGSCSFGYAETTAEQGKDAVTYSYRTTKLSQDVSSELNPYDGYGLKIRMTIPNYLGTIEAELQTSEGSGLADVVVLYVPDEKWDEGCYYGAITAAVTASQEYHILSGAEAVVGWEEWYNYGFLPMEGGVYVYDRDAVQLNFLQGPGLYTGYATLPFSLDDLGTDDYYQALAVAPDYVGMTALGYPFVLVLDDATIAYYLENGTLDEVASYGWPALATLLEEQKCVVSDGVSTAGFDNFVKTDSYFRGRLSDLINDESWYMPYVSAAYEYGLMKGYPDNSFRPGASISLAELVSVAARVNDIYSGGSGEFSSGKAWYSICLNYAIGRGILDQDAFDGDYSRHATKADAAVILSRALPGTSEEEIISLYADVSGGLTDTVTRAEVAAVLVRLIDQELGKVGE